MIGIAGYFSSANMTDCYITAGVIHSGDNHNHLANLGRAFKPVHLLSLDAYLISEGCEVASP